MISYERRQTIPSYYESVCDVKKDIDQITWNDLDLETLYHEMNQTKSAAGEEYLYAALHMPLISNEEYEERKRIIQLFQDNVKMSQVLGRIFSEMGKLKNISLFEYLNFLDSCKPGKTWVDVLCILGFIFSVGLMFFKGVIGFSYVFISIGINMILYYREKSRIGKYYDVIMYLLRMFYGARKLTKQKNYFEEISNYHDGIRQNLKEFRGFRRASFLIMSSIKGGSIFDILMDYVRMIFHVDLIKFNQMVRVLQNKREILVELFETIGFLDAMLAVSLYREKLGEDNYSLPEWTENGDVSIEVEGLFHPLLDNPVKANMKEKNSVLITGSNASGKSTFLKAVAINALLSQTICTSTASYYRAPKFKLFSSMALSDNIFENESYFIVEIKSLKRILDNVDDTVPMLCFIDEVLRGTNTLERIAASSQILYDLSKKNVLCFAATHDIELTYILEKYYSNYHFTEDVVGDEVKFEYRLYSGRAESRNAIKLLSMLGYPNSIVTQASEAAGHYLEFGEWKIFE